MVRGLQPAPESSGTNGHVTDDFLAPVDRAEAERKLLGDPLTQGYRPTLPLWATWTTDTIPQFYLMRDIELMLTHPIVTSSLDYFKGGVGGAEFWGGAAPDGNPKGKPISDDVEVSDFVMDQCNRYWDRGVPLVQGGYEYGWIGCEPMYVNNEKGQLLWDHFQQFSPRDVFLLTAANKPVGIRVKNIQSYAEAPPDHVPTKEEVDKGGAVDLWMGSKDVPAKGIWYAHRPRYSNFFGQSQILGAWRPWRRLAWKDGMETTADGGMYRFAYSGPFVKYPDEDYQSQLGVPNTTPDSQGRPRRYGRDMARQIAEQSKAGAGIGVPSTKYPSEMGGGDKWAVEFPKSTLNVEGLIAYIQYLINQIRFGIGVPPEMLESGDGGSGYSGRSVPFESFMLLQQRLADALLLLFVEQILRPLVRWNFGPVQFDVQVKNLLETKRRAQMGKTPAGQGIAQQGGLQDNGLMSPSQPSPDGSMPVPGLRDQGGAIPMPAGGGFSIGSTDKVRELARLIQRLGRAA